MSHTIGLVLDPDASGDIVPLSERMDVWVVDTPPNRRVMEAFWAGHSIDRPEHGLTLFSPMGDDAAEICRRILPAIELHHGEFSEDPPYQAIVVLGCLLSDMLRSAFGQFGLTEFTPAPRGFRASRPIDS